MEVQPDQRRAYPRFNPDSRIDKQFDRGQRLRTDVIVVVEGELPGGRRGKGDDGRGNKECEECLSGCHCMRAGKFNFSEVFGLESRGFE